MSYVNRSINVEMETNKMCAPGNEAFSVSFGFFVVK